MEPGSEALLTQESPASPTIDPQVAEKVLTKELAAETAKTDALQAQLNSMDPNQPISTIGAEVPIGNDYEQVQAALDAQKAAQADAQAALDAYKSNGTLSEDDKIKVLSTQEQLANGPGTLWSAIGSVKDFFTGSGNAALSQLSDPNIDNQPPEVAEAAALRAGGSYLLGGVVGEAQTASELVSNPDESRIWECVTGCTTERVIAAANTAALAYGGWEMAAVRGVEAAVADGVTAVRTLESGGTWADAAVAIRDAEVPAADLVQARPIAAVLPEETSAPALMPSGEADSAPLTITRLDEGAQAAPLSVEPSAAERTVTIQTPAGGSLDVPASRSSYFDNRSNGAIPFIAPESAQSLKVANANGASVEVSAASFPSETQAIVRTPAQYEALLNEYIPSASDPAFIPASKWTQFPWGDGTAIDTQSVVLARSADGTMRELSQDAYVQLRTLGDEVYGVPAMRAETAAKTDNVIEFNNSSAFPSITDFGDALHPATAMVPMSSAERADFIRQVSEAAQGLPAPLWEKMPNQITMLDFKPYQSSGGSGGFANYDTSTLWINTTTNDVTQTFDHEIAHFMDNAGLLPNNYRWMETAYASEGAPFGFGTTNGAGAIQSGILQELMIDERPEGFARAYGFYGGIQEDKATMVEYMMTNYPAMSAAAQTDPILAAKMQMVQDSLYQASKGVMDQTWWQGRPVLDPNLQVPPSAEALTREFETWSQAPTVDTGFAGTLNKAGGAVLGGLAAEWAAIQSYFSFTGR